jgi:hypothetical protein
MRRSAASREPRLRLLSIVCENAVKYATGDADAAGLAIRVRGTSSAVILEVEDHGVGVDPADLPRIFERFYREPPREHVSGEWPGLPAQMIAHRLGGTITVMSPACDSTDRPGTLVTMTLPRVAALSTRMTIRRAPRHVLIAGAGLADLAAARVLNGRGIRTTVIDTRDRVGGRCGLFARGLWVGNMPKAARPDRVIRQR